MLTTRPHINTSILSQKNNKFFLSENQIQCRVKATEHQTDFDLFVDFIGFAKEFVEEKLQNNWKNDKTF